MLITGYGAYGINLDKPYDEKYIPLLNRGWILAFAHVRGGGEKGLRWHKAAIKDKKMTSIDDFIACTEVSLERFFWFCKMLKFAIRNSTRWVCQNLRRLQLRELVRVDY